MQKHSWWRRLHWPEYGSELLGTAFLVFIALSAVTFNFGSDSPLAIVLPNSSVRRLITGLVLAGCGPLMALSPPGKVEWCPYQPPCLAGVLAARKDVSARSCRLYSEPISRCGARCGI